jgi:PhoP regulatory network protein YrbL
MHVIELGNRVPVASGSTRDVYLHPGDDSLLIKVVPAGVIERRYVRGRAWYKTPRRYRHFMTYLREVREQIALRALSKTHPPSLQKIVGFADTDLGFGLVVKAVRDRQGRLAPTLEQLLAEGRFDATARADLEACIGELMDLPIVLADMHIANFVYGWSEEHGDHFVLIDGIGCKNLIPFNRLSCWVNRYSKGRRVQRLMRSVDDLAAQAAAAGAAPQRTGRQLVAGLYLGCDYLDLIGPTVQLLEGLVS